MAVRQAIARRRMLLGAGKAHIGTDPVDQVDDINGTDVVQLGGGAVLEPAR